MNIRFPLVLVASLAKLSVLTGVSLFTVHTVNYGKLRGLIRNFFNGWDGRRGEVPRGSSNISSEKIF